MPGPLAGITVLDLTRLAPGPFCTMILGDMGAEVIRVQEPGPPTGRRAEQAGAAGTQMAGAGGTSAYNALHRNKKSIGVNLKDPEARDVFYQLVRKADVLVEELRPGVAKRLSIDYDTLKEINPRLIYCKEANHQDMERMRQDSRPKTLDSRLKFGLQCDFRVSGRGIEGEGSGGIRG